MNEILDDNFADSKNEYIFKLRPIIIWGIVLLIGIVFKIQHWPLNGILILSGTASLTAYSISGFISLKGRSLLNNILFVLGILWMLIMIKGALFYSGPYDPFGAITYGYILIICFIVYEILKRKRRAK